MALKRVLRRSILTLIALGLAIALAVGLTVAALAVGVATDDDAQYGDLLFVTDRADRAGAGDAPRFGGGRGPIVHGRCTVRFRDIPLARGLARALPIHIPTEFRDLHEVVRIDPTDFDGTLRGDASEGSIDRPVVLFVHGYAYGFGRACRQGAELQRRLGTRARVVLFTWPSDGNPMDYGADRADAEWAAHDLAGLLDRLLALLESERLRIVAHSLGTRTVIDAFERLRLQDGDRRLGDHLVLMAPDYDAATFAARWPLLRSAIGRTTLYASEHDRPLDVSASLHEHPRLGQAGDALTILDGIQTIDVSPLGRYHPTGHEYHRYHPVVVEDFITLLVDEPDAARRERIETRSRDGERYFVLTEDPNGLALNEDR